MGQYYPILVYFGAVRLVEPTALGCRQFRWHFLRRWRSCPIPARRGRAYSSPRSARFHQIGRRWPGVGAVDKLTQDLWVKERISEIRGIAWITEDGLVNSRLRPRSQLIIPIALIDLSGAAGNSRPTAPTVRKSGRDGSLFPSRLARDSAGSGLARASDPAHPQRHFGQPLYPYDHERGRYLPLWA